MSFLLKQAIILAIVLSQCQLVQSQKAGVGTNEPDASSILELKSNQQGILIPRMTTQERDAILNPVNGLMVFNLSYRNIDVFDSLSQEWIKAKTHYDIEEINNYALVNTINLSFLFIDPTDLSETIHYFAFTPPANKTEMYNHSLTGRWVEENYFLQAPLEIPVGSYVNHIDIYYYDNSNSNNCTFHVAKVNTNSGANTEIIQIFSSSGSSSQIKTASVLSSGGFYIQDEYAYFLSFSNGNNSNIRIRGARVNYSHSVHDQ